jgi:hypothetical protein
MTKSSNRFGVALVLAVIQSAPGISAMAKARIDYNRKQNTIGIALNDTL